MSEIVFAPSCERSAGTLELDGPLSDEQREQAIRSIARSMRGGIVRRGSGSTIVRYPSEIYAERDPER